jgi:IclR family acetate operon transcriptional repressor
MGGGRVDVHEMGFYSDKSEKEKIKSLEKAFQILELFSRGKHLLTFSDIRKLTKMPIASLYRFLSTLSGAGYLEYEPSTKQYSLGSKLIFLGTLALEGLDIVKISAPYMETLKEKTGETVTLFVRRGFRKICVSKVESDYSVRYTAKVGQPNYLHVGASGKVLLLGLKKEMLDALEKETGFPRMTDQTITSRSELETTLEKVRVDGYAVSSGERQEGSAGIGVPVYDFNGEVVASLNISLPAERLSSEKTDVWVNLLRDAGMAISKKMGYMG